MLTILWLITIPVLSQATSTAGRGMTDTAGYPGIAGGGEFSTLYYGRGYNFYSETDATVNFTGMPSLGTTLGYCFTSVQRKYSRTIRFMA